jgi:hypothetical protein
VNVTNNGTLGDSPFTRFIDVAGGSTTVTNTSSTTLNGWYTTAAGSTTVFNNVAGGAWNMGLSNGPNAGAVTINNAGQFNLVGVGGTVYNLGASTAFNNQATGVIAMQNANVTDRLVMGGAYTGTAGSTVLQDVNIGSQTGTRADVVQAGTLAGTSTLRFNFNGSDANRTFFNDPIVVATGTGGNTATFTTPDLARFTGLITYSLERRGNDWVVASNFNGGLVASTATSIAALINGMTVGFHQSTNAIVSRPGDPAANAWCGGPWARTSGGYINQTDKSQPGASIPTRTDFRGWQVGADIGKCNINGQQFQLSVGPMAGRVDTEGRTRSGSLTKASLAVPFVGGYMVAKKDGVFTTSDSFNLEVNVRRDFYTGDVTNRDALIIGQRLKGEGNAVSGHATYRYSFGERYYVEPSASLIWTQVRMNNIAFDIGRIDLGRQISLMGRLGATFGATYILMDDKLGVQPFVTANLWNEFRKASAVNTFVNGSAVPLSVTPDRVGTFGQIGVGVAFQMLEEAKWGGLRGFVRGDFRFGQKIDGVGVNAGLRFQF